MKTHLSLAFFSLILSTSSFANCTWFSEVEVGFWGPFATANVHGHIPQSARDDAEKQQRKMLRRAREAFAMRMEQQPSATQVLDRKSANFTISVQARTVYTHSHGGTLAGPIENEGSVKLVNNATGAIVFEKKLEGEQKRYADYGVLKLMKLFQKKPRNKAVGYLEEVLAEMPDLCPGKAEQRFRKFDTGTYFGTYTQL